MRSATSQVNRWTRLLRFLTGGGVATLVHWLVMFALIQAGTDAIVATATGASVGLAVNYLAQHRYTFRSGLAHRVAFPRYLTSAALGWSLNLIAFSAIYTATGMAMASQAAATAAATLANYLLAEKFVFQEEQTNDTH
ncbi:GtrA family protein [Marinobacter subterrani]|uniref:Putative flippase GtrA (Transmembrane translocase of bactoprenol-linked glucose) n=1 Tax=Marinobacter subterrani TaxID=1658765 RepID=A0A0J7J4L4_9GAMM|nr:GtrA family protein [Marinobacter subterrani]KMQ73132.1 putative flippase GtrA (transmembrane translocase of bactoprenol-linked glucose) [Marinobacter subterrani]